MSNIINTAPCRFCGQMVQIESEEKLTEPQAEENLWRKENRFLLRIR